jgi:multiple sugar transport system ATP-binding protein
MNLVEADVRGDSLEFGGHRIPLPPGAAPPEGRVIAGLRPEAFEDAALADPALPTIEGRVEVVEELGADTHVLFGVDAARVDVSEVREAAGDDDALLPGGSAVFTARVDPATTARVGSRLRLALDPSRFHYFEPGSGARLEPGPLPAAVA